LFVPLLVHPLLSKSPLHQSFVKLKIIVYKRRRSDMGRVLLLLLWAEKKWAFTDL